MINAKDVITIGIAVVSLMVAAATAWFNTFRETEYVSVVPRGTPYAYRGSDGLFTVEPADMSFTFFNSGNRPVLVLAVYVSYGATQNLHDADCNYEVGMTKIFYETTFEPVILKSGEVVLKAFKLGKEFGVDLNDAVVPSVLNFPNSSVRRFSPMVPLQICYLIRLSTPTKAIKDVHISAAKYDAPIASRDLRFAFEFKGNDFSKPYTLLQDSRLVFWP